MIGAMLRATPSTSVTVAPEEETASSCDQVGGSRKLRRSVNAAMAASGVCHPEATASVLSPSASCPAGNAATKKNVS